MKRNDIQAARHHKDFFNLLVNRLRHHTKHPRFTSSKFNHFAHDLLLFVHLNHAPSNRDHAWPAPAHADHNNISYRRQELWIYVAPSSWVPRRQRLLVATEARAAPIWQKNNVPCRWDWSCRGRDSHGKHYRPASKIMLMEFGSEQEGIRQPKKDSQPRIHGSTYWTVSQVSLYTSSEPVVPWTSRVFT